MLRKIVFMATALMIVAVNVAQSAAAQTRTDAVSGASRTTKTDAVSGATRHSGEDGHKNGTDSHKGKKFIQRLTVGGYGEAVATYNFYSDNFNKYKFPDNYKDTKGHGRVDLPHAVIMLGYDFGKGWTLGTEIEFEHGGTESAVEYEDDEAGEFEKEIERGGEVALEQFWIQKSFMPQLNVRAGHIIVPVGLTNTHHLPVEFFTVYRPEGENTIMPCTWHETGLSIWGQAGKWRYEAMILPGLNSNYFNNAGWIHDGSASPYEFKVANNIAGAARVDRWFGRKNSLRLGLSGYIGNSFNNDLVTNNADKYKGVKGTVAIGSFDFTYDNHNFIVRGSADYGHLSDADYISAMNKSQDHSTNSPYPHTLVGKSAVAAGIEAGYDFFGLCRKLHEKEQKLYLFGRYEYYDPYIPLKNVTDYQWTDKNRLAVGLNYYPIPEIVIKAEYSYRMLKSKYNNEPSFSIAVAWSGFFKH